jgi:ectoine hydroxylase-related dioxygenase (phytanoyl-CoA dioxygenase family)
MHQDYPYFPHERHSVLAASVHLDRTDEENGCLHVIPGSHAWGPLESQGESHTVDHTLDSGVACPAGPGDVLFFNYLTVHGSGSTGARGRGGTSSSSTATPPTRPCCERVSRGTSTGGWA